MFAPPKDKFNSKNKKAPTKLNTNRRGENIDENMQNSLVTTKISPANYNRAKRSSYKTKSHTSEVDETLFGSPNRQNTSTDWNPPWNDSNKNSAAEYLVWSPSRPGSSSSVFNTPRSSNQSSRMSSYEREKKSPQSGNITTRSNIISPRRPMSARSNKYRLRKHTETYVDETLFGSNTDFGATLSYKDRYNRKEKIPFMANSAWTSPLK